MNTHASVTPWCRQQTRTQEIERWILYPRGYSNHNVPDCVPYVIVDLSWTFHENPLFNFTVILLTDTPRRLDGRPWNSLVNYFLYRAWHFMKISWKSVYPFFHDITYQHGSRKWKINTGFKRLTATSQKYSRLLLVSWSTFADNFMKIRSTVF